MAVMDEIEWNDPPVRHRRTHNWEPVAAALKERPGQWAKVAAGDAHRQTPYNIANGQINAFKPAGAFEGRSRIAADGTYDVYARYVGGVGR